MTDTTTTSTDAVETARTNYINGLHRLADLLDSNPAATLPYDGTDSELAVFIYDEVSAQAWIGWLVSPKRFYDSSKQFSVHVTGRIGGIKVLVYLDDDLSFDAPPAAPTPLFVDWLAAVPA